MKSASVSAPGNAPASVATRSVGSESLWYKDAVFYELHVRAFRDSNGDGIGDFPGLIEKLDYLQALGITTIWLLPFYPSPLKDDGYDISDYVGVHPDYGTIQEFETFLREAHRRGLKVVIELVLNHTSDQHAWFQRARHAPEGSPERDFYVWSQRSDVYSDARVIFKDFELSNWTWDPIAKAYFWHRFYSHQPDLNYRNHQVVQAIIGVIDFWLDLGVDGLRLDAVPYLAEAEGTSSENLPQTHEILKSLRRHIDEKYVDRMLLAEANQWPEAAAAYFGAGDECHMAFHFPLMPRLFMALRQEDSFPILDILSQTPDIPESCQWALFLRNHDELTLEMVTEEERLFMWHAYARDPEARINLGIRRRLAPLLRNDRRRMELMNALLLSMPGTPVLYYGDEIGMGDNIYLGDRNGVRTPMQWAPGLNAGFSEANPQRLYLPVIVDPEYHHAAVHAWSHENNPSSFLNWMRRVLAIRRRYPSLGRGTLEFMDTDNSHILAYERRYGDQTLLVVANLSRFAQHFSIGLAEHAGKVPVELFGRMPFPTIGDSPYSLSLGPHSFFWFSLEDTFGESTPADSGLNVRGLNVRGLNVRGLNVRGDYEAPVVQLRAEVQELLYGAQRVQLEEILSAFLRGQPWFHGQSHTVLGCTIRSVVPIDTEEATGRLFLLTVRTDFNGKDSELYLVPVSVDDAGERLQLPEGQCETIVRLEFTSGGTAVLRHAAFDPRFVKALLRIVVQGEDIVRPQERLEVLRTDAVNLLQDLDLDSAEVRAAAIMQANSVAVVGDRAVVKLFRRVQEGINPDVELTTHLMRHGFSHAPVVAGSIRQIGSFSEDVTLAVVQGFIENQGTAWDHSLRSFEAYVERVGKTTEELPEVSIAPDALLKGIQRRIPRAPRSLIGKYLDEIALLGQRVGEMHEALASDAEHPSLAPEPFTEFYQRSLYQRFRALTVRTFARLEDAQVTLPASVSDRIGELLAHREDVMAEFDVLRRQALDALRIRCHGNLHLENVLCVGDDFMMVDFEGEATLPLYERRLKAPPLTDAVSLVRSIFYVPQAYFAGEVENADSRERAASVEATMRYWQYWVAVAFLRSYRDAVRKAGMLPTGADFESLLRVLFTARTVYELGYEQAHRPGWLAIPLDDLLEIVRRD